MKKRLIPLVFVFILSLPFLIWAFIPKTTMDIAIVDKTVPRTDYREHLGLFQILWQQKLVKPNGENYDLGNDYFGYDPYEQAPLPPYNVGDQNLDLIYISDTYGVYSDDIEEKPDGDRSELIYGGMSLEEWNAVMASKGPDTTLIAEYNTFASPTDRKMSRVIQQNLGVTWTGWIGRFFEDFTSDEVPAWLVANYEEQYETPWPFTDSGIAFVHDDDHIIIVETDIMPQFKPTERGSARFEKLRSSSYGYWFDVVTPARNQAILANYHLNVSDQTVKELKRSGLSQTFPAVLHDEKEDIFYFAGDYADYPNRAHMNWVGSTFMFQVFAKDERAFYWRSYVPLMQHILTDIQERNG
ncbi:hypothetical protein [Lentibacillus saliphilus]|uniref:hypothetical protein n=1 Tax=Lentibacillus saliphilus TaxID=2737028 RepID=UPI001C2FEE6F|nr:hypothetical protein [Lentibacillus saliphilus]